MIKNNFAYSYHWDNNQFYYETGGSNVKYSLKLKNIGSGSPTFYKQILYTVFGFNWAAIYIVYWQHTCL